MFGKSFATAIVVGSMVLASTCANAAIRAAWSVNSMGCAITEETARKNNAIQTGGKTKFRPNSTGTITLICPITSGPLIPETRHGEKFVVKQLGMTWQDGDASGNSGEAIVQLRKVRKDNGAVTTIAQFSSNDPGVPFSGPNHGQYATHAIPPVNTGLQKPGINHSMNFQSNFYYVQITLKRSSTRSSVSVMGATIWFG